MNRTWTARLTLILVSGTIATATQAQAQAAAAAAPAPANPKLAGNWEGTFTSDGPSGGMTTTLTAGSPWTVSNALNGAEVPAAAEARDVVVDGDKISWKQAIGDFEVTFKAALNADGTQLTGSLEAMQNGSFVGGGSFSLARKV